MGNKNCIFGIPTVEIIEDLLKDFVYVALSRK